MRARRTRPASAARTAAEVAAQTAHAQEQTAEGERFRDGVAAAADLHKFASLCVEAKAAAETGTVVGGGQTLLMVSLIMVTAPTRAKALPFRRVTLSKMEMLA